MKPGHILVFIDLDYEGTTPPPETVVPCERNMTLIPGLAHQRFYVIDRRVKDIFGYWGVVSINGKDHVVDGSVPTHVERIPRDALEITGDLFEDILHDSSGDHSWAGRHRRRVASLLDARAVLKANRVPRR